ncbi:cytochrome P450 [Marasmius fiardii PR-910]|nr:cytochrome P450 [Marasmius fiardii PR-910]
MRFHQKILHQGLHVKNISPYHEIQRKTAALVLHKLRNTPEEHYHHIEHFAAGVALKIAYGYDTQGENDPYIKLINTAMDGLAEIGDPGALLLADYLPVLKYLPTWMPGAGFKKRAQRWAEMIEEALERPWRDLKRTIVNGVASPSFSTRALNAFSVIPGDGSEMEEGIKECAAMVLIGKSRHSAKIASTTLFFVLAMVLHPEVQKRAREEMEAFTQNERLPDFEDRESLPYIGAIVSECLRWNPMAPLAIPHSSIKDDVYKGFFIPSIIVFEYLLRALLHDETMYGPEPMRFNPDRFLKRDGEAVHDPVNLPSWGYGRRACPGRWLAVNTIWITVVCFLTAFEIDKADGEQIIPEVVCDVEALARYVTV